MHQNVEALVVHDLPDNDFELQSHWILLTKNMRMATSDNVLKYRNAWENEDNMIEWPDDYSSLLRILEFW